MAEDYSRGMVKYTSRDYESLISDFWDIVPKMTELWKPEADADPGVVLGKFLVNVADMLGVNLDWLANEMFAPSVSQRKNAERLFSLIGYELGWYTAARTEVTFTNIGQHGPITLDFGFNGANFCTLNAYTDITGNSRVITYNILPLTNKYGAKDSRSRRRITTELIDVFADTDEVTLKDGESVTRVAIEGELRSYSVSVQQVKGNNYIINVPSQHIDTTAIWIKARTSKDDDDFLSTQWVQVASPSDFVEPEPRFAVTYDSYSNAQIQISNYLNQLENYENNYLTVYWIDCTGVIGCVGTDVLTNLLLAKNPAFSDGLEDYISISNLSNTLELPHTNAVTGKSPETAKEAYFSSRNYINTFDSLVTLPDFNRFLNREPGVDCGLVIDCQKALEINLAIYNDESLTELQRRKLYITNQDFPMGDPAVDWSGRLNLVYDKIRTYHLVLLEDTAKSIADEYGISVDRLLEINELTYENEVQPGMKLKIPSAEITVEDRSIISNFKTYTAMCFCVHNDFQSSRWGNGKISTPRIKNSELFMQYKPPTQFIEAVKRDYAPLQAMTVELQFGYLRVFNFYVVGQLYPVKPVTKDVASNIITKVKEDLALYFAPANRHIGQKPTVMEVVDVIRKSDSRIDYFDAGSLKNPVINWFDCDIEYFNAISFAKYTDPGVLASNIRIAPEYIVK